jgi:hypothetical protein
MDLRGTCEGGSEGGGGDGGGGGTVEIHKKHWEHEKKRMKG